MCGFNTVSNQLVSCGFGLIRRPGFRPPVRTNIGDQLVGTGVGSINGNGNTVIINNGDGQCNRNMMQMFRAFFAMMQQMFATMMGMGNNGCGCGCDGANDLGLGFFNFR